MSRSRGLGKGLQALIPIESEGGREQESNLIALALIDPNPFQPRRSFDEEQMAELVQSIRQHGVVQPVVLRQRGTRYQLVAGERRCRAARQAGLREIPAVVRELDDEQLMELAIVENLQREDLNPIEEAQAYAQLMERLGLTQEQVAERVGRSRPHIANTVRLLQLPRVLQEYVSRGTLTAGHARALLSLSEPQQLVVAEQIISQGLNVRQAEQLARQVLEKVNVSRETRPTPTPSPEVLDVERQLQTALGTKVKVVRGRKRGKIEIEFYSGEELERLIELLLGR
ncbi:MAG: ParB/RepB/Spo0J family partition protein [Bacillota bacterium]